MLKEKFFIVVLGTFEREPIVKDAYPTDKEILEAIKTLNGNSARVEKRYVVSKD